MTRDEVAKSYIRNICFMQSTGISLLFRNQMSVINMLDFLLLTTSFAILACGIDSNIVDASKTRTLPPIYWNASSPIFSQAHRNVKFVHLGDRMDIICPMGRDGPLYYSVHQVSEENFRSCNTAGTRRLLMCNSPHKEKKYTFLFQVITPSPWGLVFAENKSYYFISTSDGTMSGINNTKGGACTDMNMKLIIAVNKSEDNSNPGIHVRPKPPVYRPRETTTTTTKRLKTIHVEKSENEWKDKQENNKQDNNKNQVVNSNGLVIGVVLGACAVLFIVLLSFLGYKVYRRRRQVKKYQSPSLTNRVTTSQAQVTLLPISHQTATHLHTHGTVSSSHHHHLNMQDLRPPPPYNESIMDHAGSTMDHAGSTMEV